MFSTDLPIPVWHQAAGGMTKSLVITATNMRAGDKAVRLRCCTRPATIAPGRHVLLLFFVVAYVCVVAFFYHWDTLPVRRVVQEQERRKTVLRDMCRENKESSYNLRDEGITSVLHNLLVDDNSGIIYCFVPKVACTHWKRLMQALKHGQPFPDLMSIPSAQAHSPQALTDLASFSEVEREVRLKHYTKFMFVREPFVRLVSAFRDKLLTRNQDYYAGIGRLLLHRYANKTDTPLNVAEALELGIHPSFYNFVQYLLDPLTHKDPFDYHWKQFYLQCQPCLIEYDFIGHQETIEEDALQLLMTLNLEEHIKFPPPYQNVTTLSALSDWFKDVPLEDRRKLYKLYERDYKLFGYQTPHNLLNDKQ